MLPTAEAADRRDREARERLVETRYAGYQLCRGYPVDHVCITLIPWTREPALCSFCAGTLVLARENVRDERIPSVGAVLADLKLGELALSCPCGGDKDAPYHTESLSHLRWLAEEKAGAS